MPLVPSESIVKKWAPLLGAFFVATLASTAQAVPSYARQTGQACVACHVSFPELTPYGRWFKLSGYTIGVRQTFPVAAMAQVGVTSIKNNDDGTGTDTPVTARDHRVALNGASIFVAGKASDNVGGFIQYTFSEDYGTDGSKVGHSGIDNTDVRWVGRIGSESDDVVKLLYGLTLHNNPTAQDVWNSTPAFGFPFTASPTAVGPTAGTQIEGALGQQVAGIGAYGFYDKTWYGEVTAYRTADGLFSVLRHGQDTETPGGVARLKGYNPYVRGAYNKEWGAQSLMIGAFALQVNRYLDNTDPNSGTDRYADRGVDAQYQYISNPHTFSAQARYVREHQDWRSSFAQGLTSNPTDTLNSTQLKATYYYEHQYGITLSRFALKGSADANLYPSGAVTGSGNGSPDSRGYILELDYLPVQNVRLMMQYTGYTKFNGGGSGYDGATARSPSDNNSLFFNLWVAF
ncbi:MAG: cytochrome C [Pseudomonadota bacterium]|nr:cytochrome C [Pseudomonadota bacterium]